MSTSGGSREQLEQALAAAREVGDLAEQARVLRELGALERAEGHSWRARRHLENALEIYRETNDLRGVTAVMGELEPVADAEADAPDDGSHATASAGAPGSSDLISMRPAGATTGAPLSPTASAEGARLSPSAPPGGSRREGTSWPMAVGFLVLLLAVAGGLAFLAIRLVGDFLDERGDDGGPSNGVIATETVEPRPSRTRVRVQGEEEGRVTATPLKCDVAGSDVFSEVSMRVRLSANQPFQVVVLRGTLTARGGREIGNGIMPVTPVSRGTQQIDMTFTVFEDVPRGRVTCGVEIQTAVPQF